MNKNKKNKTLVGTALIASLLSIGFHTYLTLTHYQQKLGVSEGKSLCNINSHLNCDVVALTKYASLFNYPIALWGAMTHIVLSLFLSLWFLGLLNNTSRVLRVTTWLSLFIAATSLVMGSISSFILGIYCLFCLFTFVLSFVIAGSLIVSNSSSQKASLFKNLSPDFKSLFSDHKWMLMSFLIIPLGTIFSGNIIKDELLGPQGEHLQLIIQESLNAWQVSPAKTFSESAGLSLQADQGVPQATIVEFADFLCPHCKVLSGPIHNFVLAHPGVRLIYKPFSFDGICNNADIPKRDGLRCELVYATLCAENLFHKGWEAHEYIFAHQSEWDIVRIDKHLIQMSTELSLNLEALKECMKKTEIHQATLDLASEGREIKGTPTIFVNGRELPHGNVLPVLEAAILSLIH